MEQSILYPLRCTSNVRFVFLVFLLFILSLLMYVGASCASSLPSPEFVTRKPGMNVGRSSNLSAICSLKCKFKCLYSGHRRVMMSGIKNRTSRGCPICHCRGIGARRRKHFEESLDTLEDVLSDWWWLWRRYRLPKM